MSQIIAGQGLLLLVNEWSSADEKQIERQAGRKTGKQADWIDLPIRQK